MSEQLKPLSVAILGEIDPRGRNLQVFKEIGKHTLELGNQIANPHVLDPVQTRILRLTRGDYFEVTASWKPFKSADCAVAEYSLENSRTGFEVAKWVYELKKPVLIFTMDDDSIRAPEISQIGSNLVFQAVWIASFDIKNALRAFYSKTRTLQQIESERLAEETLPRSAGLVPATTTVPGLEQKNGKPKDDVSKYRGWQLNYTRGEIRSEGGIVRLSNRRFDTLGALFDVPGEVVPSRILVEHVRGHMKGIKERDIEVLAEKYVTDVGAVLERCDSGFIITRVRDGYKLSPR